MSDSAHLPEWQLYEDLPIPCLILMPDLRIVKANTEYLTRTGLQKEQLEGRTFSEIVHTDTAGLKALEKSFARVLKTKKPDQLKKIRYSVTGTLSSSNGEFKDIKNVAGGQQTNQPYLIHFISDVTGAEDQGTHIRASSNEYEMLVNSIGDYAIFFMDKAGIIRSWNKGAEKLKGYTAAEAIGMPMDVFYLDEDRALGIPALNLENALKHGRFETSGWRKRKDGSTFYAHIIFSPLVNEAGVHHGFSKITRDVSVEMEEKTQRNMLANITRNIQDPIITTDLRLTITSWNAAAERMFGWNEKEALGRNTGEVLQTQIPEEVRSATLEAIKRNGYWEGELSYLDKSGKKLHGLCKVSQLKDGHGEITGNLILIKDITVRILAEQELSRLNNELELRVIARTNEVINTEKKYQVLFESNPMPVWVIKQSDFSFIAVNNMATLHYGYSREEFLSMTALDIRPEEDRESFAKSDHSSSTTKENYRKGIWKHKKKDGTIIHVQVAAHDIFFEGIAAKIILANDITEMVKAEESLAAREVFFRSIIENSAEGISLVDENYKTLYRSQAALRIAGKLDTDNPMEKIHPDDRALLASKREELVEKKAMPIPFLARFKNGKGNFLWLEGTFTNLLHVEGVKGIVTNFRDVTERVLAEEKLAASEKQFSNALNNMLEGAQIIGFDWRYKYVNDTLVNSSKFSREELLGAKMTDLYPGIENTQVFYVMQRVMETRMAKQLENEFTFRDGSISFFQLSIQPVPEGIFVLSIDITERKTAEAEILKGREVVNTILERISDSFLALDKDWNYSYVNKAAGILVNRSPKDMVGKNMFEEYPEVTNHPIGEAFRRAMETQQHLLIEEFYEPLDAWLQADIYPSPDGLSVFLADVSKRRKAELDLKESQDNIKAIFDNASEGFILTDKEGIIKIFNNNITDSILLGVSDEVKKGETIFKVVEPDRVDFFRNVLKEVLRGKTIQYDRPYTKKGGQVTWINLVINPVYQQGVVEGICITGRDVTDKKNAEKQLEKSFLENLALSNRLSIIINTLPANVALLDKNGDIMEVNKAWDSFCSEGFKGKDFCVGGNYVEIARKSAGRNADDGITMARGVSAVLQGQLEEFVYEYSSQDASGEKWYRMVVTPLKNEEDTGVVIMHMDISELRKLEAERMRQQKEQQQRITKAILRGQEKERNHIGRELHDNINQILAGTRMYLSIAGSKDELIKKSIQYPLELLDESIKEIRVLCSNMVTPLQDVNLEEMIRELLRKLAKYQISFDFTYDVPGDPLSDELKLNIYRIIQEVSQNITKYAKASTVSLAIWTDEQSLNLVVEDNGKGFDTSAKRNGIGILNMQNRVKSFNGKITIDSAEGAGTRTSIAIPYREIALPNLN
ncbi:MAG: PAS domain S-box protein [Chitinophagaceae bacterium]|nr:MAG: PAS domain S-box protein [Chitinophagaceae bacterium]